MSVTRCPLESQIERSLQGAGIAFTWDAPLDFELYEGIGIEVKRFYSERLERQISDRPDVIVVQGKKATDFFCRLLAAYGGAK
ncbi:MAG: hypothetical protein QNJ62_05060 [Methyloceanibacter sp.]|nr:hypothetical protein [Methyloceanibacter sp.]